MKAAVKVQVDGEVVGYLPRRTAGRHRVVVEFAEHQGRAITCDAIIVGGWDRGLLNRGSFGIWLDLASPATLDRELSA